MATLKSWTIKESDFPQTGDDLSKIKFLLRYAILAPSSWNAQPWLFKIHQRTIQLFHDTERLQGHRDPQGRENIISCGAALSNLEIALHHFGFQTQTEIMPPNSEENLLAQVTWTAGEASAKENKLFRAILQRHSYRKPFQEQEVPAEVIEHMQSAAQGGGCEFIPITCNSTQVALAGMISEGDKDLGADVQTRKEYAAWMRSSGLSGDGVPGYALADTNPVEGVLAPLTHRVFNYTDEFARSDRALTCAAPLLGVLTTPQDTPKDWVDCGRALERLLLSAAAQGVQASFLNQTVVVPELRQRLQRLLGLTDWPQIGLRFGYPTDEPVATPRRKLDDVLLIAP